MRTRIVVLSPASLSGKRAELLLRKHASSDLAAQLRENGAELGKVYSFVSSLYFRGKLAYGRTFAGPPAGMPGVLIITPGRGLLSPETLVTHADLLEMSEISIDRANAHYTEPLDRHCCELAQALPTESDVVLLGSIATDKYLSVLLRWFPNLLFPTEFIGRGDMSRGGLLLRCVTQGRELECAPVAQSARRGCRPPKLGEPPSTSVKGTSRD